LEGGRLARGAALAGLHAFQELLEVFLRVATSLVLGRLIHPFRFSLDLVVAVTSPAAVKCSSRRSIFKSVVIPVTVSPALGPIDPLASCQAVTRGGISLEPGLGFAPCNSIAWPGISGVVADIPVSRRRVECSSIDVGLVGVVPISSTSIIAVAISTTHSAIKALGAFMAEALSRLHGTPAIIILVAFPTSSVIRISSVSEAISNRIILGISSSKIEATSRFAVLVALVRIE